MEEVINHLKEILYNPFNREDERSRTRKIIFWYDPKKEYESIIDELELDNTEIIKYDKNSFWIRYHIEREELSKNIIIYFPFDKRNNLDNDLLDLEVSNSDLVFNPDMVNIKLRSLCLKNEFRHLIIKYEKFFANNKRLIEFKNFDIEKNVNNFDLVVTSVLLKIKTINEDEILKEIIKSYYFNENKYEELFKFGNMEFILDLFNNYFGSEVTDYKELSNLYEEIIISYFSYNTKGIINSKMIKKETNNYVFVNNLMRDKNTKECFELISRQVEKKYKISELLTKVETSTYMNNDAFEVLDKNILTYLVDKLVNNSVEYDLYENYIDERENKYFYCRYENEYKFLKYINSFLSKIENIVKSIKEEDIDEFANKYANTLYEIDTLYRKIYFYYDKIEDNDIYIELKNKIEDIYMEDFISKLSIKWSGSLETMGRYDSNNIKLQSNFYKDFILPYKDKRDRVFVIISDAFRYECAKELNSKLTLYAKSDLSFMQGVVPSYTKLGMASLLPHKSISRVNNSDDILVDNMPSSSTEDREKILINENSDSLAITFSELADMTKVEWKKIFSGKKVVYIYHNIIDAMGEHNEKDVFDACDVCIKELEKLIKDLHNTFSGITAFITADHGFFYKRSKVQSYEKTNRKDNSILQKTRYSYSSEKMNEEGILSISLDYIFGDNSGYVNVPKGNMIFARQGNGVNYIHGGVLPQEIIVPVISFKSSKQNDEIKKVGIVYTGLSNKITSEIVYLEFLQDTNVDENYSEARYTLHFEDEEGIRVSDECTIIANYANTPVKERIFREKFVFKNIRFDRNKPYYLIVVDEENNEIINKVKFYIERINID